jgi:sugar phosphate isomerase/epimerase
MNATSLLQKADALGVDVVQICDNLPLHKMDRNDIDTISVISHDKGISIEVGTRGVDPANLLDYLNIANLLHARILRTTIHSPNHAPSIDEAIVAIREVLPNFTKAGVSIALENHERYTSGALASLVSKINSQYVGICLDTVNSFGALEDIEQIVTELARYTLSIHVKDFDIVRVDNEMGFKIVGRPVGEGRLDVAGLFDRIKGEGMDPNAILELWTPFSETVEETIAKEDEWAKRSIRFLKGYVR